MAYNTSYYENIKTIPANANFKFTLNAYKQVYDGLNNVKAILTSKQLKKLHQKIKKKLKFVR